MKSPVKSWTLAAVSLLVVGWGLPAESQVPAAPTISATQSGGRVTYTYVIQPGMTGLTIQEAADAGFTSGVSSIGAPVTTTTYGFPHACTIFYYRAVARNSYGSSAWSAAQRSDCVAPTPVPTTVPPTSTPVPVMTAAPTSTPLAVPSAPTISAVQSGGRVTYTYVIQPGMTGLTIQEAADAGFTSGVSSIGAPVTTTSYGYPHVCATFYYRAVARNASGSSPWSAAQRSDCVAPTPVPPTATPAATAVPVATAIPPTATPSLKPAAPTISATQSGTRVTYTYVIQPGMTGLTIQEASDAGFTSGVSSIGAPVTTTTYGFPHGCYTFYYRAVARNSYGSSPYSAAQKSDCPCPLAAVPASFTVKQTGATSANGVDFAWTDAALPAGCLSGHTINITSNAGENTNYAAGAGTTAHLAVTAGVTYTYKINAAGMAGTSAWSSPITFTSAGPTPVPPTVTPTATIVPTVTPTATKLPLPATPTISATQSGGRVTYTYVVQPGVTSFTIQEAADAAFTSGVSSIGAPVTTTTYGFPHACTIFYYRARVTNSGGSSAWSAAQQSKCP